MGCTDTTLAGGRDTLGAIILVKSGSKKGLWYRDSVVTGGHKWTLIYNNGGQGVSSFNGRTDVVVPTTGDYTFSQITGLQDSLNTRVDTIYGVNDSTFIFIINSIAHNVQIRGGEHGGGGGYGNGYKLLI